MRPNPLLAMSHDLCDLPDRETYLRAAGARLLELLPGDDVFWMETDFGRRRCSTWRGPSGILDLELGQSMTQAEDHPAIRSYVADPQDLSPRRISDVSATMSWRGTRAHDLLSAQMGRHQLSLIVRLTPPDRGNGWTVGRSGTDFDDADLETADAVLPLLTALDRIYERRPSPVGHVQAHAQAQERSGLTRREIDVLTLVADGLKANAIGHVCRISSGTVRKHLEHAYAKLGCHDRLMAVQELHRLGLLPAPRPGGHHD